MSIPSTRNSVSEGESTENGSGGSEARSVASGVDLSPPTSAIVQTVSLPNIGIEQGEDDVKRNTTAAVRTTTATAAARATDAVGSHGSSPSDSSPLLPLNPHESYPLLPGPFVVLQGTPGDGMANTMDSSFPHDPFLEERRGGDDVDSASDNANNEEKISQGAAVRQSMKSSYAASPFASTKLSNMKEGCKRSDDGMVCEDEDVNQYYSETHHNHKDGQDGFLLSMNDYKTTGLNVPRQRYKGDRSTFPRTAGGPKDGVDQQYTKPPPTLSSRTMQQQIPLFPTSMEESFIEVPSSHDDHSKSPYSPSAHKFSSPSHLQLSSHKNTDNSNITLDRPQDTSYSQQATSTPPLSSSLLSRQNSIVEWTTRRRQDEICRRSDMLLEGSVSRPPTIRTSSMLADTAPRISLLDSNEDQREGGEWWHQDGRLAVFSAIPSLLTYTPELSIDIDVIATLPPGCTVMGTDMVVVDSETFMPIAGASVFTSNKTTTVAANHGNNVLAAATASIANPGRFRSLAKAPFAFSSSMTPALVWTQQQQQPQRSHCHYHPPGRSRNGVEKSLSFYEFLRIESPVVGYVLYGSGGGCTYLGPGLPSYYVEPTSWTWRVTCPGGAVVRSGLELTSAHLDTLPPGCFVRVTRKTVNAMGLSRLRVEALRPSLAGSLSSLSSLSSKSSTLDCDNDAGRDWNNRNYDEEIVVGWCSEFLNPLSGQRGPILQPLSLPVPALYRVTLDEGAVIRSDVELSSPQVAHAPRGSILVVVGRAYSEHPMDQCIERLRLAGGGGWVSVRLNRPSPGDIPVVELVGIDGRFDPESPGEWHWDCRRAVLREWTAAARAAGGASPSHDHDAVENPLASSVANSEGTSGLLGASELSSVSSIYSHSAAPFRGGVGGIGVSEATATRRHERCLICLTEERTATIVHGETGHVACCLVCARILKARGDRCPVCRLPIDSVVQQFWA